jgi:hypothetical protein
LMWEVGQSWPESDSTLLNNPPRGRQVSLVLAVQGIRFYLASSDEGRCPFKTRWMLTHSKVALHFTL